MRVLVVEEELGAGAAAEQRLQAAGHETATCADPNRTVPCKGLAYGLACPLEEATVDAALLVVGDHDSADEPSVPLGYLCARRQFVPIVAHGGHEHPVYGSKVPLVRDVSCVVDAVEEMVLLPLPEHSAAARDAVRSVLDRHGLREVDASSWVERRDGKLNVHISTSEPIPHAVGQIAAVRVLSAVRQLDPTATSIGVGL